MYISYELTYKSLRVAGTKQTTSTVIYNWHQTKTADIVSCPIFLLFTLLSEPERRKRV
jgi:hypothetical protein